MDTLFLDRHDGIQHLTIDLAREWEVQLWTRKLDVSEVDLLRAVAACGVKAVQVIHLRTALERRHGIVRLRSAVPSKFHAFSDALRALYRQHHVAMAPTEDGLMGVWDIAEGDVPVDGLHDWTEPRSAAQPSSGSDLPAFLRRKSAPALWDTKPPWRWTRRTAAHAGAVVVPIGPPRHIRSWAVISPHCA